jgi:hypothetical protein
MAHSPNGTPPKQSLNKKCLEFNPNNGVFHENRIFYISLSANLE